MVSEGLVHGCLYSHALGKSIMVNGGMGVLKTALPGSQEAGDEIQGILLTCSTPKTHLLPVDSSSLNLLKMLPDKPTKK